MTREGPDRDQRDRRRGERRVLGPEPQPFIWQDSEPRAGGVCASRRVSASKSRAVSALTQRRARQQPPCRLNDENSRGGVQTVRRVSSAIRFARSRLGHTISNHFYISRDKITAALNAYGSAGVEVFRHVKRRSTARGRYHVTVWYIVAISVVLN
jgi:hypothetical protein